MRILMVIVLSLFLVACEEAAPPTTTLQLDAVDAFKKEKYLNDNAAKAGVTVTESGLQYEVLASGNGRTPTRSDRVLTHYHGTFIDGSVFDSSVDRGQPAEFPVGGVIKGWSEALTLMKEGDKWRLVIPSDLAYGSRGAGSRIPPDTPLVFEVELLEVK